MKKYLLALSLVATLVGFADTENVNGVVWNYTVTNDEAFVGLGESPWYAISSDIEGEVVVPGSLGGFTVKGIAPFAFAECKMSRLVIPDSVTEVGFGFVQLCPHLTEVVLPKSLEKIGEAAFTGCPKLSSVYISEKVTQIGDNCFWGCKSLSDVRVDPGNAVYSVKNGLLCTKDGKRVLFCLAGNDEVVIPDEVGMFDRGAFTATEKGCTIVVSSGMKSIPDYMFEGAGFSEIVLPETLTSIGNRAFLDCSNLNKIDIPNAVAHIGSNAFSGCSSLRRFVWPRATTTFGSDFASAFFDGCINLEVVELPDTVTKFRPCGIEGCQSLRAVIFEGNTPYVAPADAEPFPELKSAPVICYKGDSTEWSSLGDTWYGGLRIMSHGEYLKSLEQVIVISPSNFVTAWQGYAAERYAANYVIVDASTIYSDYPYGSGVEGAPRNPAESIHAFICDEAKKGVKYFMLGGAWLDVRDDAPDVYFQGTETKLTLDNAIPGIYMNAYNNSPIPSDLFYACFDDDEYHWDKDGDGIYLNDVAYDSHLDGDKTITDGTMNYDLTPDVIVSRMPLKTATGMDIWGINVNNSKTDIASVITDYSAKVTEATKLDFIGRDKYALIAGAVNDNLYQRERNEILPLFEREYEYYDGLPNFGDPAHGNTGNATTELLVRRRLRDQIAAVRPVVETDILSSGGWARRYKDFGAAVSGYLANSHEFDMMYSHGLISGGQVWGLSVGGQFLHPGYFGTMKGLNLFADYAGPCFGGIPDLTFERSGKRYIDFSCTEAMIANSEGGAVAAVGNARSGIYEGNYTLGFDNDFSWIIANRVLENFITRNTTAGEAWKNALSSYYTDGRMHNGTHVLIIAQEMLYGDPLMKLPEIAPDPALIGFETSESALTINEGRGHGGQGVVFKTSAKGRLTLDGNEPYYLGGLKNADLQISGSHKLIDLDACEIDGTMGSFYISRGATNTTLRSIVPGVMSKLNTNTLSVPSGGSVVLQTWNAFGNNKGKIQVNGANCELVIAPNLCYPEREGRGEALNADFDFMNRSTYSIKIRVAEGGLFTPIKLSGDKRVSYVVDARDGLGGDVTVPSGAKLVLNEIPLTSIDSLTVESGATLVIPEGEELERLIAVGSASLKTGAKIAVGNGEAVALTTDVNPPCVDYVQQYYYGSSTEWNTDTKVSRKFGGDLTITPAEKDIIVFAHGERAPVINDFQNLYIKQSVNKNIRVTEGTTLYVGAGYGGANGMNGRSFVDGWEVSIDEGSSVVIAGWGHARDGVGGDRNNVYGMDGTVTFNGQGEVCFATEDAKLFKVENVKGSAVLNLRKGTSVTVIEGGFIENPLSGEGTLVVSDMSQDFVIAPGWEGTFDIPDTHEVVFGDPSEDGTCTVSFAEKSPPTEVIRQWSDAAGISHDSASPVVLFTGITLDDLMSDRYTLVGEIGGAWIKGGNYNITADMAVFGEKSGNEVNVQLQAKDSDSSFTGVKFVNLKLVEDGATIRAYQYGQGNKRSVTYEGYGVFITSSDVVVADTGYILKFAVAWRRYVIEDEQTWDALPSDFHTGDTIEVTKDGELTLTFAMPQPVIGSGRVVTTVSPSTVLKDSLKADSWTGTFVLKGLEGNVSSDDLWNFDPSNYGNAGSQVELWNCKGFTAGNVVIERPIIITGEFCFLNGYDGRKNTLSCLKGTGTITSTYNKMTYTVLDASEFYGVVENESVVILPTSSPSMLKKNGYLSYTIDSNGVVQDLAVTEKAKPTIGALTLGDSATVTIAAPIAGLTYALKSAATLDAEAWEADASTKAESSKPLTLEAKPSTSPSRFYKVEVSF